MLYIDEIKSSNNSVDLVRTENDVFEKTFTVVSKNKNDNNIPFSVEVKSSDLIDASTFGGNSLKIVADTPRIKDREYVIIKNSNDERLKININPNSYFTMKKDYKFRITRETLDNDGVLKLKILSKVNDMEMGWKCTYMGQPITYDISPLSSKESCYISISNKKSNTILADFHSLFVFEQKESGKIIKYNLHNTPNGIIIDKKKDDKK